MLLRTLILSLLAGLQLTSLKAQDCTCSETAAWAVDFFEANDAGFRALVMRTGSNPYAEARTELLTRAAETGDLADCGPLIFGYLTKFRVQHIGFSRLRFMEEPNGNGAQPTDDEIRGRYAQEKVYVTKGSATHPDPHRIAGDYHFANYKVRVVPVGGQPARYVGYILEADGVYWRENQVKFTLTADAEGEEFNADFKMRDHQPSVETKAFRLDDARLIAGGVVWTSTDERRVTNVGIDQQLAAAASDRPVIYHFDEETMVIRFPDFGAEWSDYTDSLVAAHYDALTSMPKLIVDLRGNGGGADRTYQKVMDLVRTRTSTTDYDVSFLNTDNNRTFLEGYLDSEQYPEDIINYIRKVIGQLNGQPAGFVTLAADSAETERVVYRGLYPARVGVLIDRWCGSSGEQFALDARESWKVKLFGEPTIGGIDASNLQFANDRCENYRLIYTSTVTARADIVPIDGIGVQPDYPLDLTGNPYDVIGEVARLMGE